MSEFVKLAQRVADLERRMKGMVRYGTVEEVDPAAGTVRLKLGEGSNGTPFLSAPIPYAQTAGAMKFHNPPSKGQQMAAMSPDGDLRQAIAQPLGFSNANASPSNSGSEHKMTFGSVTIALVGGGLNISVGGVSLSITGGGLALTGGTVTHNSKNIGDTHTHTDTAGLGAGVTSPPN